MPSQSILYKSILLLQLFLLFLGQLAKKESLFCHIISTNLHHRFEGAPGIQIGNEPAGDDEPAYPVRPTQDPQHLSYFLVLHEAPFILKNLKIVQDQQPGNTAQGLVEALPEERECLARFDFLSLFTVNNLVVFKYGQNPVSNSLDACISGFL